MFIVYFLSLVLSWVNYFSKRTSVSALLWACDWLTQERQCSWPEWKGWGSVFLREGSRLWENISRMWPQQKLGNWGFQWSFLIYSLFHFLTACLCCGLAMLSPFSARGPLYERIIFCLSSRLFMGCFCDVAIVNGVFVGVDAQKLIWLFDFGSLYWVGRNEIHVSCDIFHCCNGLSLNCFSEACGLCVCVCWRQISGLISDGSWTGGLVGGTGGGLAES